MLAGGAAAAAAAARGGRTAAGGNGRAAAPDGGDAARGDLQPRAADVLEADAGGYREAVRAAVRRGGEAGRTSPPRLAQRICTCTPPWLSSAARLAWCCALAWCSIALSCSC